MNDGLVKPLNLKVDALTDRQQSLFSATCEESWIYIPNLVTVEVTALLYYNKLFIATYMACWVPPVMLTWW